MRTECIEWHGKPTKGGYGRTKINGGVAVLVHRRAWELMNGPIQAGLYVCHHCDNRKCFNVAHLFLGTHADNMHDMKVKGRRKGINDQFGEDNPNNKLSAQAVHEIRVGLRFGASQGSLARLYGIGQPTVSHIEHGQTWVSK